MADGCKLCHRAAVSDGYCSYHGSAVQKVKESFAAWSQAYGGLGWEDYLDRLTKTDGTGKWVLEVIRDMKSAGA
ncbi:MAG: hypothetical protein JRN39_02230 [Nitrososphaerota archaeon]|nr:hypothetical protein [Nitrososphaerota archaeon]